MQELYIRADGNAKIGLGHLVRTMALAQMLRANFNIHFIAIDAPNSFIKDIKSKGFSFKKIKSNDDFFSFIRKNGSVLIDHYDLGIDFQKKARDIGCKVVCIDDLNENRFYADLIINHNPDIKSSDYSALENTRFALGTNYALLRPAFIEMASRKRVIDQIDTAFVCFGGADGFDLSLKVVQDLLKIEQIKKINVVLGSAYQHQEIFAIAEEHKKVKIYKNLDDIELSILMQNSQLAVVPSSSILYEVCTAKMVVLAGYYIENQKGIYHSMLDCGAILGGGDFRKYKEGDFYRLINAALKEKNFNKFIDVQKKLFDGNNSKRFLDIMLDLNIKLKKATEDELMMVYNWSNDEIVRENSFNREKIDLKDHKDWYKLQLNNKNAIILIVYVNSKPAGMVRYKIENNKAVVGILISKDFRGKKLGSYFLRRSANYYFKIHTSPILAYIKEVNKASIRIFEKAGYSFYKKVKVNNTDSLVYRLKKNELR